MKYWCGYLIAAILGACTWAFREFAQAHSKLVDMVYPYVTRMLQTFMADWSSGMQSCLWEALLLVLVAVAVATIVLMIIFKWNPIQWFGWVLAAVSLVVLLHTGMFGMNEFSGPIAEDIRLHQADCDDEQLEAAAIYYRDQANALAQQVSRNAGGTVQAASLEDLNLRAAQGFQTLVYEHYYSVFAGSTVPVKELSMADWFTKRGEMGYTVAITGEAAVNPQAPAVMLPYALCREMCYRMCIASDVDMPFGAFLACQANESADFQYAAYLMAYRYCLQALPQAVASTVDAQASQQVKGDMALWNDFVEPAEQRAKEEAAKDGMKYTTDREIADLLIRWHYQTVVLPSITEPEVIFDPMDESQVDLTGLPHGPKAPEPTETTEATEAA